MTYFFSGSCAAKATAKEGRNKNGDTPKRKGERNMSKIKKVLAVILSMAMILGMSLTTFAANGTAQISVTGLATTGTNTVQYYKILTPDVKSDTGYKFAEGVTVDGYADDVAGFIAADSEDKKDALNSENSNLGTPIPGIVSDTTFTATVEAGLYAVFVTNTAGENEEEVIYTNPMIVSVGYKNATLQNDGTYEYDTDITSGNNTVVAKYTTIPITKEGKDDNAAEGVADDDVVEIGGTATYTIETYLPSEVTVYTLTDTLTDATYNKGTETVVIGEGGADIAKEPGVISYNEKGQLVVNLSNYLKGNAGKKVTVTYQVTVTGTKVENSVIPDDGKHSWTKETEKLYTGALKFTKYGEDNALLANAVFNVKDSTGKILKFKEQEGIYYLSTAADAEENVTTGTDGTFTLYGLNLGNYTIVEVQAPEGYSINTEEKTVTVADVNTTRHETLTPAQGNMTDTKLSSLPSTGGIGTTIFTIGGCAIMIAAAGMFFVSRRKENK